MPLGRRGRRLGHRLVTCPEETGDAKRDGGARVPANRNGARCPMRRTADLLALDPLGPMGPRGFRPIPHAYSTSAPLALDPLPPVPKSKRQDMKIVIIGGRGLIGSKFVPRLDQEGHEAVAASPASGVDTLTGDGLPEVLENASVVVDV